MPWACFAHAFYLTNFNTTYHTKYRNLCSCQDWGLCHYPCASSWALLSLSRKQRNNRVTELILPNNYRKWRVKDYEFLLVTRITVQIVQITRQINYLSRQTQRNLNSKEHNGMASGRHVLVILKEYIKYTRLIGVPAHNNWFLVSAPRRFKWIEILKVLRCKWKH